MLQICIILIFVVLAFPLTGILILGIFWSRTKYGKLNYKAAIILKFRNFFIKEEKFIPKIMRQETNARVNSLGRRSNKKIEIKNLTVSLQKREIPIRLYYPNSRKTLPVFIYYHGGGWVTGNIEASDDRCREYSYQMDAITVSVHYRRAPENKYPAALNDCYAVLEWVKDNISDYHGDPTRIAIGGPSSGGNLAAAVALMSRDKSGPKISHQLLIYPVTNVDTMETDSYRFFKKGYGTSKSQMLFFKNSYLSEDTDRSDPYISPLLADSLKNLPPTMVITAGFDVLRDEGVAYAQRLMRSGVRTKHLHYPSMIHGFTSMNKFFSEADDVLKKSAKVMRVAFNKHLKNKTVDK